MATSHTIRGQVWRRIQSIRQVDLFFFFACVLLLAIILSPFLLSVSMFGLAAAAVCWPSKKPGGPWGRVLWPGEMLARWAGHPLLRPYLMFSLFLLLVLFSVPPVADWAYFWERLRIKVPFVALPLTLLLLPPLGQRRFRHLIYVLLWMLSLTGLGIVANYLLHAEAIHELMLQGQPMPTPRNHIRFSLLVAFGILGGLWLLRLGHYWRWPAERRLIALLTVFLFALLHFLSVKTGLLAFYAALLVWALQYTFLSGHYWRGAVAIAALLCMPVLAWHAFPSFQAKVRYTQYDLLMYQQGEGHLYGDSGRLTSLLVGWDIVRQQPWLGVGAGNLRAAVTARYQARYPDFDTPHMPHNQFLFVMAGTGALGLAAFLFAFFAPLLYRQRYRHPLLLGFYALLFVAFCVEHSLENSMGVAFFCFPVLLLLSDAEGEG